MIHGNHMKLENTIKKFLIKKILLLSIAGFLLVIVAGAFHYNDKTFLLRSRTVCKIKTLAGSMGKNKIGSATAVSVPPLDLLSFVLLLTAVLQETTTIFIPSQVAYIYPNKAPPAIS